jgi:ureidoacrylate peracid hydrolase
VISLDLASCRPALLVVDLQAVFVSPDGPFANTTADDLIARIDALAAGCRAAGAPVVLCTYLLAADGSDAGLLTPFEWAVHFRQGAAFAGVDPRLGRAPTDVEVRHHRPGCFHGSGLEAELARLGCDAVVLAGVSVNNAISTTAREAFARDIPALVVRDCVGAAPWEPAELFDAYVDALGTWTAEVATAADVLARLPA